MSARGTEEQVCFRSSWESWRDRVGELANGRGSEAGRAPSRWRGAEPGLLGLGVSEESFLDDLKFSM